ncbi:hypothetical protein, partial [Pseudomonas syringae group genomosp. 7]|uniref:hypothetical protein n=1 Tax=Pseudomonas syringae group genomosp. 7 TaxID=251699 RepID=UPI00376FA075
MGFFDVGGFVSFFRLAGFCGFGVVWVLLRVLFALGDLRYMLFWGCLGDGGAVDVVVGSARELAA